MKNCGLLRRDLHQVTSPLNQVALVHYLSEVNTRLSENIRLLRQEKKLTQKALAQQFGLTRTTVSAWEEGRAEPRVAVLVKLCGYFGVTLDQLIYGQPPGVARGGTSSVRVLPIAIDRKDGNELVSVVPVKAAAGYLDGYGDLDFIASLPTFRLPVAEIPQDMTLRMFQIEGDSMLPIQSGSYVLASYVEEYAAVGNMHPCIAVTRNDGIVFKRVANNPNVSGLFTLCSDNPEFQPFNVAVDEILELWRARAYIVFNFDIPAVSRKIDYELATEITASLQRIERRLT